MEMEMEMEVVGMMGGGGSGGRCEEKGIGGREDEWVEWC